MPSEIGPREKAARALREQRHAEEEARQKAERAQAKIAAAIIKSDDSKPPRAEKIAELAAAIGKIPAKRAKRAKAKKAKRRHRPASGPPDVPF